MKRALSVASALLFVSLAFGCKPKENKPPPSDPPPVVSAPTTPVPQAMPVGEFDASLEPLDGKTPLEQAQIYRERGQLFMAQMVLENKALGDNATKAETEELAQICHLRSDDECVQKCQKKLGKRLKFDGGLPSAPVAPEHKEPTTDLARARDLLLQGQLADARRILEPKVLDGKGSKEEVRLLKQVCKQQGDRMCVALCDAKLR